MRADGGYKVIIEALKKLGAPGKQEEHLAVYGSGNEERLTGKHETASMEKFTYGVANRGVCIVCTRIRSVNVCVWSPLPCCSLLFAGL